jgi:glycosyltransferase involved in cell wall biosynthesis
MKVLILHDTSNYAGTESHIMTLATGLSNIDGVDIELLVPDASELHQRCVVNTICHHVSSPSFITFFLRTFYVVRKYRPQVLHTHNGRTTIIAVLVSKLLTCKVVATQHFLDPAHVTNGGIIGRLKRIVHQWVGKQLDFRICVSQATLRCMEQRGDLIAKRSDLVKVIYSGITQRDSNNDLREHCKSVILSELRLPCDTQLVLTAARLEREKSVDTFVRALIPICLWKSSVHAVVAGDGAEAAELRSLSEQNGVSQQIHFLGFRSDVDRLMLAADLFVLSSSIESFGMVLLEAMVSRTPVIAPDGGGPKEIVVDHESGLLYSPGDVGELTDAIKELLDNPKLCDSMAERAYSRAISAFSVSQMASETLAVYSAVLAGTSYE